MCDVMCKIEEDLVWKLARKVGNIGRDMVLLYKSW